MDRSINYPGAIPLDTDLLSTNKFAMVGLGNALRAALGPATQVDGLACGPTLVPSLAVKVDPGAIYALQNVDGTAYGSLDADTTHQTVKQGLLPDAVTLATPAPGTAGQSVVYLIQAAYADQDASPVVLPYYNASDPAVAYSGPANSWTAQNTVRKGVCVVSAKTGVPAATGAQTTPAPDAGYVGLYAVTVANAQSTVTSGNIARLAAAPFLDVKLPGLQVIGSRPLSNTTGGISLLQNYPGDPNGHVAGNAASGVSPPDLAWDTLNAALYVCTATGPAGSAAWARAGGRKRLTGDLTLYVRPNGSDGNDGLANTAGGAFATIQKAADVVQQTLDLAGYVVTVQVADGTYAAGVTMNRPFVGGGPASVIFTGNAATPANVLVDTATAAFFALYTGVGFTVRNLKITTTGSVNNHALGASDCGEIIFSNVDFGACAGDQIFSNNTGIVRDAGPYTISGGAPSHINIGTLGMYLCTGQTVTLAGTPAYSAAFIRGAGGAAANLIGNTYTGSATGKRYDLYSNATVQTNGMSGTYLPGSVAGTTATGGQYV